MHGAAWREGTSHDAELRILSILAILSHTLQVLTHRTRTANGIRQDSTD